MKKIFGSLALRTGGRATAMVIALLLAAASAVVRPAIVQGGNAMDTAAALQDAFASVAEQYRPTVVSITASKVIRQAVPQYEFFFGDPFEYFFEDYGRPRSRQRYLERKYEGGGSGVIIDPDGYVLTNYHVVTEADTITVHLDGDKSYEAKVVGKDPYTDLAIIKIKGGKKFPAAPLGDSDKLRVGDWVIAIGSPFGLEQTVTSGIVSAKRQSLGIEGRRYENLIQTDAAINRGNSGGPLVNLRGEVVGINTAIYAPTGVFSGIGFAIPVNRAKAIVGELIAKGKVSRGWLGVEIREMDAAIARQFGVKEGTGVLVNSVTKGSPADKAGIKRGDVILRFNGERTEEPSQLQALVQKTGPGKKAAILVERDKKEMTLEAKIAEMPGDERGAAAVDKGTRRQQAAWKGITVIPLTADTARRYGIDPSEQGVVVDRVDHGKNEMGLREGDLIKAINRREIASLDDFNAAVRGVDKAGGIVFDIVREGLPLYITYSE